MRSGLDVDAVLEADVGRAQHFLPGVDRVGDVVKPSARAVVVGGEREVVALVRRRHPRARFVAVVEDDHLRRPHAEHVLEEQPQRANVGGEQVQVVEPPHVRAARRKALRLVLERGLQVRRRREPLRLVIDLHPVAVGRVERVRAPVAEIAIGPSAAGSRGIDDRHAVLERLGARRAKGDVAHARHLRRGELERVMFVVVPRAEVHRIAAPSALRHAHDVGEEPKALIRLRREQLDVREMGEVR